MGVKSIMLLILDGNKNFKGFTNFTKKIDNLNNFESGSTLDKKFLIDLSKKDLS